MSLEIISTGLLCHVEESKFIEFTRAVHTHTHTISTSPHIDTYTHIHKLTCPIPAHENRFGFENKVTIYTKSDVLYVTAS